LKRLVRTGAAALPPSADNQAWDKPVSVTPRRHTPGTAVRVMTFCGVELTGVVKSVRIVSGDPVYDVTPMGNLKIAEQRKAGVPVDETNARQDFVAFEWQITR